MERVIFKDLNEWLVNEEATTNEDGLNKLEQTSIQALASYTAHENGSSAETVLALTANHFGVDNISLIQHKSYDDVVRFLLDLEIKEIIN